MRVLIIIASFIISYSIYGQIENGMVAHFSFDNTLVDQSASNITAVNNTGVFGLDRNNNSLNAIELDGVSSFLVFNEQNVKVDLPITISAWVKINSSSTPNVVFASDNEYGDWNGYFMNIVGSGNVILSICGGTGHQGITNRRSFMANSAMQTGVWNHVVGIIRDYDDMSIYLNCIELSGTYSGSGPTTMVYSSAASIIGGSQGGSTTPDLYFDGSIDQLVIWNRELSTSEINFMCDINNTLVIDEISLEDRKLVKIIDLMGREVEYKANTPLIFVYNDGTTERIMDVK